MSTTILSNFLKRTDGNIALILAIVMPVLGGGALFAVDYTELVSREITLQSAADTAALSATREQLFLYTDESGGRPSLELLHAIADSSAQNTLDHPGDALVTRVAKSDEEKVRVDLSLTIDTAFGSLTGLGGTVLSATATAEIFTAQDICLLLLEESDSLAGIIMENSAQILAGECGLHSNSADDDSIKAKGSAYYGVGYLCSVGGFEGSKASFRGKVITDCPPINDPLAARPSPRNLAAGSHDPCPVEEPDRGQLIAGSLITVAETRDTNFMAQVLTSGNHTMMPGLYCGGLVIEGTADVWMEPGEYIFNGGPLIVRDEARLQGEYVGLFLDDASSYFQFLDEAEVELSAPRTGTMAGILVRTGPKCGHDNCSAERPFWITSSNVRSLLGTIYLPDDRLVIDTTMPVSEEAAFTIIVAERLHMKQSPTLVLNTDYAATNVPRPGEIENMNRRLRLTN